MAEFMSNMFLRQNVLLNAAMSGTVKTSPPKAVTTFLTLAGDMYIIGSCSSRYSPASDAAPWSGAMTVGFA